MFLPSASASQSELSTVCNDHWRDGLVPAVSLSPLDRLHHIHAFHHLTKDHVLAVQPWSLNSAEEELRSVGVGASIGHGEDSWAGVLELEVLIGEGLSVDALAASAVASSEVATPVGRGIESMSVKGLQEGVSSRSERM